MSCIANNIEIEIERLIKNMRRAEYYNYDWSVINEEDEAIGDFPRAIIDPRDTLADKETSRDALSGISDNAYTNEVLYTILVSGQLPAFDKNPSFAIRSSLRLALDDLKKVFGINNQLQGKCDNILYVSSQIESLRNNDVLGAAQLRTTWRVVYTQDRQDPTIYASS